MKKSNQILCAVSAMILMTASGANLAVAGSCGTQAAHVHAEEATTLAIYPLAEEAGLTTLVAAVKAAGLDIALSGEGPFTVFAPTNEAFAKLPEGTVESLLANPEQLKKVLLYHVVSGNVMAAEVVKLEFATTLNGTNVAISTKDGVKINDAMVLKTDIEASNGTVHLIDTVLIPENL